jgi:hypothetical protein
MSTISPKYTEIDFKIITQTDPEKRSVSKLVIEEKTLDDNNEDEFNKGLTIDSDNIKNIVTEGINGLSQNRNFKATLQSFMESYVPGYGNYGDRNGFLLQKTPAENALIHLLELNKEIGRFDNDKDNLKSVIAELRKFIAENPNESAKFFVDNGETIKGKYYELIKKNKYVDLSNNISIYNTELNKLKDLLGNPDNGNQAQITKIEYLISHANEKEFRDEGITADDIANYNRNIIALQGAVKQGQYGKVIKVRNRFGKVTSQPLSAEEINTQIKKNRGLSRFNFSGTPVSEKYTPAYDDKTNQPIKKGIIGTFKNLFKREKKNFGGKSIKKHHHKHSAHTKKHKHHQKTFTLKNM